MNRATPRVSVRKVLPSHLQTEPPGEMVCPVKVVGSSDRDDIEVQTMEGETVLVLTKEEAYGLSQLLLVRTMGL